jgi:hypothetical protein
LSPCGINVSYDVLLYDLTSTYFEADPPFSGEAHPHLTGIGQTAQDGAASVSHAQDVEKSVEDVLRSSPR